LQQPFITISEIRIANFILKKIRKFTYEPLKPKKISSLFVQNGAEASTKARKDV
jgi:hypothetical protein